MDLFSPAPNFGNIWLIYIFEPNSLVSALLVLPNWRINFKFDLVFLIGSLVRGLHEHATADCELRVCLNII